MCREAKCAHTGAGCADIRLHHLCLVMYFFHLDRVSGNCKYVLLYMGYKLYVVFDRTHYIKCRLDVMMYGSCDCYRELRSLDL
jgi:hypothetical protein